MCLLEALPYIAELYKTDRSPIISKWRRLQDTDPKYKHLAEALSAIFQI